MTLSGKTTLAKRLAVRLRELGFACLVLDPLSDPEWPTPHRYTDGPRFLEAAKASRRCLLVIDEAGDMIGRYNEEMRWAATRSRHHGHTAIFVTHRATQLAPTVRDQCTRLYLFRVSLDDAQLLAKEWARPELEQAAALPQGTCIALERYGEPHRIEVFQPKPVSVAHAG